LRSISAGTTILSDRPRNQAVLSVASPDHFRWHHRHWSSENGLRITDDDDRAETNQDVWYLSSRTIKSRRLIIRIEVTC
jgi:hypothetical protein